MTDPSVNRKTFSQTFLVIVERGILLVPQVAMVLLITRLKGKEFFGEYALVLTWAAAFQLVAQFGITECLSSELGRSRNMAMFTHGLVLSVILGVAVSLVMTITVVAFHYSTEITLGIWIVAGTLVPANLTATSRGALLATGHTEYATLASAMETGLVLPLNIYWVLMDFGFIPIIATLTAGKLMSSLVLLTLVHRRVARIEVGTRRRDLSALWERLVPFGIASVLVFPSLRYDIFFLSKLGTVAAVGTYAASVRVLDLLFILPLAFFMVMLPRVARALSDPERDIIWVHNAVKKFFIVVAPVAVGILGYAEPIVHLAFGREFTEASGILRIHMIVFLILSLDVVLAMFIKAANLQRVDLRFVFITTVLNIGLNAVWIPAWGPWGAALALAGSVTAGTFLRWHFVTRKVVELHWFKVVAVPLILATVLFTLCAWLSFWVGLPASAAAYAIVCTVTTILGLRRP